MLFLAFANHPTERLPTLSKEDDELFRLLSPRAAKRHFLLHRDSSITLSKVAEYIIRFREDLELFLYSGHAGRDHLLLEDQSADSDGIAELLGKCPKLKLVILNGCSTAGQVERLLALPNMPAVIATSAPVNDFAATQFSISFFQAFSEQYAPLEEAFQIGLAAAMSATKESLPVLTDRSIKLEKDKSAPVWLLKVPAEAEEKLRWKLPALPIAAVQNDVRPNQLLLKGLLHTLATFDSRAREVVTKKQSGQEVRGRRRLKKGSNEQRNVILKCLPLPISEQIEKLVTKRRENKHVFYDSFSYDRLKQLLLTYDIAMEMPAFILLAQLFDLLAKKQEDIRFEPEQADLISDFLQEPYPTRLKKMNFPLIAAVTAVLDQNGVPLFVPEISKLRVANQDFQNAFLAMEGKKERLPQMKALDANAISQECIEAEEMLTLVLSELCFLATYSLVSVRNIDVLRNRLFRTPSFVHRVVHLAKKDAGDPEEVEELLDDFLDNESVLLMKNEPLSGQISFLNLTPFIIDENAYVKKADNIKLYFFHHFREGSESCFFKHTYKPEDPLLEVRYQDMENEKELNTQDVWEQFEDFWNLLQDATV